MRFLRSAAKRGWIAFREGRLPLSPSLWMRHLKHHWIELGTTAQDDSLQRIKAALTGDRSAELRAFLASGQRLTLPTAPGPELSILIVAFRRPELLLACLRALRARVPFEVIIVDNGGSGELLERIDGATIVKNAHNVGFPAAVNQAARLAQGRNLLLLNHDATPLPGSIDAALDALTSDAGDVGAVGARLILPDGRLQEAGSTIRADGSCVGIGRGASPDEPPFMFRRDVDFCSGAFLLTPRDRFTALGGFDEGYGPAYYEEVDYCVRLWKRGWRVVYEPSAAVAHFEFAASPSPGVAMQMQAERRARFVAAHGGWRRPQPSGMRILVIDDRVPHMHLGSGFPRMQAMVRALIAAGHEVTFFPLLWPDDSWDGVRATLPPTVEVMLRVGVSGLGRLLRERRFDRILVSRPNNLRTLRTIAPRADDIIYDAEALFALRDGTDVASELELAHGVRAIVAVSAAERSHFRHLAPTFIVGHALTPAPTPRPFAARAGLLFVGAFHHERSPNSESMRWFAEAVLPRLKLEVTAIGHRAPSLPGIAVHERVDDLTPYYDRARVFIAPTRAGAGLPYKIHHAAAHGLPVVTTSLMAQQLGWRDELSIADDAADFAAAIEALHDDAALWSRRRQAALERVATDCAPEPFARGLVEALR
jgi:GT2 family glycosyltransferase